MKLSVLIPVYNEEFTVGKVLDRVNTVELPDDIELELIAVNDCSTDQTAERLAEAAAEHPNLTVFHHESNQGKGAAIRTAIGHSTGDVVVIQDADLEYDPAEFTTLLAPILSGEADAVFGSRFLPSSYRRVLYFWHSLGNRLLTGLSNMFTNLNLTDMETCYKMVRGDILRSLPIRSDRFGIEPELTAKLAKRQCRIYEVPITYRGRTYQEGKKITWRDGVKALGVILYFWAVDDLYEERYGHDTLHRLSKTHRFNRWMADTIRPWVGSSVLEIGAGMGNITRHLLPRRSYVVSETDPLHLHYLANVFDDMPNVSVAKVDIEDPEDFREHEGDVDTVICLNVVEHVADDDRALTNIFDVLQPGGRACVLVPRSQELFGTLDEVLEHQLRYEGTQLEDKLTAAGFEVEELFTFNKSAVPAWWLNGRILQRRRFGAVQLKIFDSLVWLLRIIEPMLPWKGLSLIAIARKPASADGDR